MSLPAFTVTTKLSENNQTTSLSIIRAFNNLITNLQQIFTAILNQPQLDSVILTNVQLNGGSVTNIPSTLGRTLTGWVIIRQRSPAFIYDTQDGNSNPNNYLQLVASSAVSVDIMVF